MGEIDYNDQQHPRELINCVLVGDSGVGKTKLICAEAVGVGLQTSATSRHLHYPSVFAIDQYHVSTEIRERANFMVDGVNVALRLWDTFGDHGMNRRFAYQSAHVIMLCFNISSPSSFKNVNGIWYPEIKKFCPRTPIILVGTHSDWRCHSKPITTSKATHCTSLSKRMRDCALVSPDMGRQVAREIGATYYETSVVTMWGVKEVFDNSIRAALVSRRQTRFWSSQLKRVSKPLLQPPFLPEKSTLPSIVVPACLYRENLQNLHHIGVCPDIQFVVGQNIAEAHCAVLVCVSALFSQLLLSHGLFGSHAEELHLLKCLASAEEQAQFFQNALVLGKPSLLPRGFSSISLTNGHEIDQKLSKVVIEVHNSISMTDFQSILMFMYGSYLPASACTEKLLNVAKYFQLRILSTYIENIIKKSTYLNTEVQSNISHRMLFSAKALVGQKCMSDISFVLTGNTVYAHKSFLISQCEMLAAMFMEGHFKESNHQVVELKEVCYKSFMAILEYLYTGQCPMLSFDDALGVIGLANFFCLPRLVALCEQLITKELQVTMASDELAVSENVVACLTEAQLHNASQLETWCLSYIASHYIDVCCRHPKELKALSPATHHFVNQQRWPPIWYLIEYDWYEKAQREVDQQEHKRPSRSSAKRKKKKCHCL